MHPIIKIEPQLAKLCPDLKLGLIKCKVKVTEESQKLWDEIIPYISQIEKDLTV